MINSKCINLSAIGALKLATLGGTIITSLLIILIVLCITLAQVSKAHLVNGSTGL